ncbi:MAG: hypothetical protein IJS67_00160 [Clostridia bacterium]|nr:hypothetical protein [Clostridia bacterium]
MKELKGFKYGVLDVGSNSVRALVYADGKVLYNGLITSRLGEGLALSGKLSAEAMNRTAEAIIALKGVCEKRGADKVFAFATEAVRSAANGGEFVSLVKSTGVDIEVVSGDEEGELGALGALGGDDGGIIDIGGASTEIVAVKTKKIVYSKSLPLGAVRLYDLCGEDEQKLTRTVEERIGEYGVLPEGVGYRFIGGTSTAVCMVAKGIKHFRKDKINGATLNLEEVKSVYNEVRSRTIAQRIKDFGINEKRAEIIVGGAFMIKTIMERYGINKVEVRLNDNMLGYLKKRVFGEGYEKSL